MDEPDDLTDETGPARGPRCPDCLTDLVPVRRGGVLRALGWWLIAVTPALCVAGATFADDAFFLAGGAGLLAGAILSARRDAWRCPRCAARFAAEPEAWGRETPPPGAPA